MQKQPSAKILHRFSAFDALEVAELNAALSPLLPERRKRATTVRHVSPIFHLENQFTKL